MSKKFKEVYEEIKKDTVKEDGSKKAVTFSRGGFDALLLGMINDAAYEADSVKVKDGEPVTEKIKVTQQFREMLRDILVDYGVDKTEANTVLTSYEIKNVKGMYELISEIVYQYMDAGKKFQFMTKYDFNGSLALDEIEAGETEHRDMHNEGQVIRKKHKKHKVLTRKSKANDWLKERVK